MFLSNLSIKRPVFATVLMLALLTLGLFSYRRLAIDMFPDVEVPVISVVTVYPGAAELCDGQDNACAGSVPTNEVDDDSEIAAFTRLETAIRNTCPESLGEILPFVATLMGIKKAKTKPVRRVTAAELGVATETVVLAERLRRDLSERPVPEVGIVTASDVTVDGTAGRVYLHQLEGGVG